MILRNDILTKISKGDISNDDAEELELLLISSKQEKRSINDRLRQIREDSGLDDSASYSDIIIFASSDDIETYSQLSDRLVLIESAIERLQSEHIIKHLSEESLAEQGNVDD